MTYWVTFSNGQKACQTIPGKKFDAKAHELGIPRKTYSWGEQIEWSQMSPDQKIAWAAAREEILNQEAQEYIDEKWPNSGVTITSRQNLPYGASPAFGSGSRGGLFCYTPNECAGSSSCPKNYACSE